ncbi:MAG: hypothetical protein AAF485_02100 [Chloroflexota bacterium]
MSLLSDLQAFDGKHTDSLETLADHLSNDNAVIQELCQLTKQGEIKIQTATTWLLKRFQEKGTTFSREQTETMLELMNEVPHWEARLHLLQMLPGFTIPLSQTDQLFISLTQVLFGQNGQSIVRPGPYKLVFICQSLR